MSLLAAVDSESLLLSSLLGSDSDFQQLQEAEQFASIMPAYITIEDVFRRVGWHFSITGRSVVIGPPDNTQRYVDDVLFSKTLSLLNKFARDDGYDFPSRQLAGGRVLVSMMEIYETINLGMVDAVVDYVAPSHAAKYRKARAAVAEIGPPNDETKLAVLSKWNKYFSVVGKIFAEVRARGQVMVTPTKGFGNKETVAALLGNGTFGYIAPMAGEVFSEQEKFVIQLYQVNKTAEIIKVDDREILVCPFDALAAIGADQIDSLPLAIPQISPETLVIPAPVVERDAQVAAAGQVQAEAAEEFMWETCELDLNARKELQRQLVAGGRSVVARDLWATFSQSARGATARLVPKEWAPFSVVLAKFADCLEVTPETPGLDECTAARLLTMKGTVLFDPSRRLVKRKY